MSRVVRVGMNRRERVDGSGTGVGVCCGAGDCGNCASGVGIVLISGGNGSDGCVLIVGGGYWYSFVLAGGLWLSRGGRPTLIPIPMADVVQIQVSLCLSIFLKVRLTGLGRGVDGNVLVTVFRTRNLQVMRNIFFGKSWGENLPGNW